MIEVQVFDTEAGYEVGTFDITTMPVEGQFSEEIGGRVDRIDPQDGWIIVYVSW